VALVIVGFDPVMELMSIREGMLEEQRTGPAEIVLTAVLAYRSMEAANADLRVLVERLSGRLSALSSDRRPGHRPGSKGQPSGEQRTAVGQPSGRPSDSRPALRASDSELRSQSMIKDLGNASEVEGEEDQDLSAAAARARANGRPSGQPSDKHKDSRPDSRDDDRPDEEQADREDGALRALMAATWDGLGGTHTSGTYKHRMGQLIPLLRKLAGEQGKDPSVLWADAVGRFKSDPDARRKRLGLAVLCAQFDRWVYDVDPVSRAVAAPASQAEHQAEYERQQAERGEPTREYEPGAAAGQEAAF
jgi:hypothetical protein